MNICPIVLGSLLFAAGSGLAQTCQWTSFPSLQHARSGAGCAVAPDGRIFVAGGHDRSVGHLASVEVFDGAAWTLASPLNTPRQGAAAVQGNGFIYVIGGYINANSAAPSIERLDTTLPSPAWADDAVPPLSTARGGHGAATDPMGRIWVVGGYANGADLASVEIYDPARPHLGWIAGPSLSLARYGTGLVMGPDGLLYAFGGTSNAIPRSIIERIDPLAPGATWAVAPFTMPSPIVQKGTAVLGSDGLVYFAGGWLGSGCTSRALRLDVRTGVWEDIAPINRARNNVGLVLDKHGRVVIIGGDCVGAYADVEAFDTNFCRADWDRNCSLDIFDFLGFQNAFAAGCP